MASRTAIAALALGIFAGSAASETSTIEEARPGQPLPTADYLVVIEGRDANFYAVEWREPIEIRQLRARATSKNEMRDAALAFAVQVAAEYGATERAVFMIVTDQYRPPHYEAYIKRVTVKR